MTLTEASSDDLIAGLLNGELDLAWVGFGGRPPTSLDTQVVADEELVAAVTPGNPLTSRTSISLDELCERSLICLPRGSGIRQALDEACAHRGLRPYVAFEASNPAMVAQIAARELGVAILPESSARVCSELVSVAIVQPSVRARVELAWRAEGPITPAARVLIGDIRTVLAQ